MCVASPLVTSALGRPAGLFGPRSQAVLLCWGCVTKCQLTSMVLWSWSLETQTRWGQAGSC